MSERVIVMAEQVLTVTTAYAREQMARARAEGSSLTKVVKMAFGSGGVDQAGKPLLWTERNSY